MTSIFVPSCRMPEKSDLIVRCWCRPGAPPRNRVPSDKLCRLPNFFVCRTGRNASAGKMSPKRWSPGLPPLAIAIPYSHAMQNATIQVPPSPSSRKFRDYVPTHLLRFDNSWYIIHCSVAWMFSEWSRIAVGCKLLDGKECKACFATWPSLSLRLCCCPILKSLSRTACCLQPQFWAGFDLLLSNSI